MTVIVNNSNTLFYKAHTQKRKIYSPFLATYYQKLSLVLHHNTLSSNSSQLLIDMYIDLMPTVFGGLIIFIGVA